MNEEIKWNFMFVQAQDAKQKVAAVAEKCKTEVHGGHGKEYEVVFSRACMLVYSKYAACLRLKQSVEQW